MRPIPWLFIFVLALAPMAAQAQHTVLVKAESSLTLREKSANTAKALGKLVRFQPVDLLAVEGDWAKIKVTDNQTGSVLTGYVLASYLTANAFASTGSEKVNGRYGPGTQYDVIIEYDLPNIPFCVRQVSGDGWVMVMDYDGDRSWVSGKSLKLSGKYVITKEKSTNVRKGVGIGEDQVFIAPKGTILQVLEEKTLADNKKWLHVKHADGDEGWLSAQVVFGWNDVPAAAKPPAESDTKGSAASKKTAKTATGKSATKKAASASDDSDAGTSKKSSKTSAGKTTTKKAASASDDPDADSGSSKTTTKKSAKSTSTKTGTTKTSKKKAAPADESPESES